MIAAHIIAVIKVCMSKFLRKSHGKYLRLPDRLSHRLFVLRTVHRSDILRHLLADLNRAGSVMNNCFNKHTFIAFNTRAILYLSVCLNNIEDLLEL